MLQLSNITVSYPGDSGELRTVVDGVSVSVAPGEHVVLLGANGSGKSSLMRCALGLNFLDGGSVRIDGLDPYDPSQAVGARSLLGFVGQRPDNQIVATSVEDEVAFGPENLGLDRAELRRRVDGALEAVGLAGMERREPHTLSGGQKQRLAIAGALAMEPRYLLLDEPTSMLDEPSRRTVNSLVASLVAGGVGALHITHDLSEAAVADRVVVVAAGATVFEGEFADLMSMGPDTLRGWGLEADVPAVRRPESRLGEDGPPQEFAQAGIVLRGVSTSYDAGFGERTVALDDVDFSVAPGELVVIKGPTGSGKSTLMKVCAGLIAPERGEALIGGIPITPRTVRGKVGIVFQDPEEALFADTVLDDVMFGPLNFGETKESARIIALDALRASGLDPERFSGRSPFTLSGGEARLAAIAGVLAISPTLVLADEPTSALDARGRLAVRTLLTSLVDRRGVVVVTHSPEEFEGVADRIYSIESGVLVEVRR